MPFCEIEVSSVNMLATDDGSTLNCSLAKRVMG